jgi:hypothetical protein
LIRGDKKSVASLSRGVKVKTRYWTGKTTLFKIYCNGLWPERGRSGSFTSCLLPIGAALVQRWLAQALYRPARLEAVLVDEASGSVQGAFTLAMSE